MDGMKKIKNLLAVSVFLCVMILGSVVSHAKPTVSKTTFNIQPQIENPKSIKFVAVGSIEVKGVSKDAKVVVTSIGNKQMSEYIITPFFLDGEDEEDEDYDDEDDEDDDSEEVYQDELAHFDNTCYISLQTEALSKKRIKLSAFDVKIKVTQGGKVYHLKTTCKFEKYKAFKKIKINGKNVTKKLSPYFRVYTMKLAGKKLKVSCKMNKGYSKADITVFRNGKSLRASKVKKLKKGDRISIGFYKRGWAKSDGFFIFVK